MKYFHILFFLVLGYSLSAQQYQADLIKSQNLSVEVFVGVDKFTNIYYLDNRTLYKSGSDQKYEFAALNLGPITYVDIVNPLKITVFYKQSNTAVILDNTLNEITRIEFSAIENFRNVSMATTANDRRLWIFNSDLQQLELFDYRLNKVIVEFPPLAQIPNAHTSNFNFCWLQTPTEFITYNIYGTIVKEEKSITQFQTIAQNQKVLIAQKDDDFFIKSIGSNTFAKLEIAQNTVQEFSLIGEILYIYNGQNLTTYTIKPN
jgi:hypothetical protein